MRTTPSVQAPLAPRANVHFLGAGTTEELLGVIQRCLERDPGQRPSLGVIQNVLQRVQAELPGLPGQVPPQWPPQAEAATRSRRQRELELQVSSPADSESERQPMASLTPNDVSTLSISFKLNLNFVSFSERSLNLLVSCA